MLSKILFLSLMLTSLQVLAGGDRVGNGGDVVVCGDKVELLDIYEARTIGYEIVKPAGSNYQQMFKALLQNHLAEIQPLRTARYLKNLETFEKEAQFLPGIKLNDVDDAGMVTIPKGCSLEQIVIQLSDAERPAGKKRYTISLDLWNRLDDFNKMSLVLHEILYREAIGHQKSNSMVVRAMVGEILSKDMDLEIYLELDAAFSESLEFKKNTWEIIEGFKPDITISVNEYNEDTLTISDPSLFLNYKNQKYEVRFAQIRLSDGKILEAGDLFKYLRANKETFFQYSNNEVSITTNKDMDYSLGEFTGAQDVSIKFKHHGLDYEVNFEHVNLFYWAGYSDNYQFHGRFSLLYRNMLFNDSEEAFIGINRIDGSVINFSQKNNKTVVKIKNGIFSCGAYSALQSGQYYQLKNCSAEGSAFRVLINSESAAAELSAPIENLILDSNGDLASEDVPVIIKSNLAIGVDRGTNLKVVLKPGSYVLGPERSIPGFYYRIQDNEVEYYIARNGEVYKQKL